MFLFQQYIQPTWYYSKSAETPAPVFTEVDTSNYSQIDTSYSSEEAVKFDAAYQLFLNGKIPGTGECIPPERLRIISDINDNYRFVRKYFPIQWYYYVFILRLLLLKNPYTEFKAFIKNRKIKPYNPLEQVSIQASEKAYNMFDDELVLKSPLVSVIIPTLNRHRYLKDALADLGKQDYKHFEVIVCDQSEQIDDEFYANWPFPLTLIRQKEKALWLARNQSIMAAKGDYILLFDDDSRVKPDWIRQHLRCINYFNAEISAGVTDTVVGHGLSSREAYFHLSEVFDTGNAMVKRAVFERVGLFDRQFEKQRMGDGEFGLRAFLAGYQLISNPYAIRKHLKVEQGGLREMGSWDAFRPKSILAPRPIPSTLYLARRYFGNEAALFMLCNTIPRTIMPYRFKGNKFMKLIGLFILPFYMPLIVIQVIISWNQATSKIDQGPLIAKLAPR